MSGESTPKSARLLNDFSVVKVIGKARFTVYQALGKDGECLAMKVFPYDEEKISPYYLNEKRCTFLSHENVIRTVLTQDKKLCSKGQKSMFASIIMTEYAPFGDFFDFVSNPKYAHNDEILVRTFLHQIVEGLEYIHSQGIAHMDLKLENILIGANYSLKIGDLDLSLQFLEQTRYRGVGTKYYRAPEIIARKMKNPRSSDIYSLGIILFVMMTQGKLPHAEETLYHGANLSELMHNEEEEFWNIHSKINKDIIFTQDFKKLFHHMTKLDPKERAKISDIKQSDWYKGDIYSKEEYRIRMESLLYEMKDDEKA